MRASGWAGILVGANARAKMVAISKLREIARVLHLGLRTNIGSDCIGNYNRSSPGRAEILACAKKVAVSESCEIVWVA